MPLDGAEGGETGAGQPVDGAEARAGRQHDMVRAEPATVRQDERRPAVERGDAALEERHPAGAARLGERSEERPVVDLVVAGDLDAAAQGGTERRDQAAAFAGTTAVCLEAERVLVGEEVVEAGAIGRIERDRHRACRVVADVETGGALQRGGESGPAGGALYEECGQIRLAELRLGDRGEHAGRHPRRAIPPGVGREHGHHMTIS